MTGFQSAFRNMPGIFRQNGGCGLGPGNQFTFYLCQLSSTYALLPLAILFT